MDAFWSISVYNTAGYFQKNDAKVYSINNYMVRLYRPRREILNGTWRFPEATPAVSRAGVVFTTSL